MPHEVFDMQKPSNEPTLSYAPGSGEREELKRQLAELRGQVLEIPLLIGDQRVETGELTECRCPHECAHLLAHCHNATEAEVQRAIESALAAKSVWDGMDWVDKASIFLRAADLLAGPWRQKLNAATMLCQSKNVWQAEIDAACELVDFWRFNVYFMNEVYKLQPEWSLGVVNRGEFRSLEGFVYAVSPFNFTSVAGNLATAPAVAGNVVVWKPASSAVYSNFYVMQILEAAGLPGGVVNFVPGQSSKIGNLPFLHPQFAGLHFTGSTATFRGMWKTVGDQIGSYRSYPRVVGETGGKNFVFVHRSADLEEVVTAVVRGAFEYQGQKCSATSRLYVPESVWPVLKGRLVEEISKLEMGGVEDFRNFVNALIDRAAFEKVSGYIDFVKASGDAEILVGGGYDDSRGYFVEPTVVLVRDPLFRTMREEIFGPVLTVFVYSDSEFEEVLRLCDRTSPYALTGAVFAKDRNALALMERVLVNSAGNFYINDKSTGSVVGQQPFGGSRLSGTNDKSGSIVHMLRWVSMRSVKENLLPPRDWRYSFMGEE